MFSLDNGTSRGEISCRPEDLIFDRSVVTRSLVEDFGFVCDR